MAQALRGDPAQQCLHHRAPPVRADHEQFGVPGRFGEVIGRITDDHGLDDVRRSGHGGPSLLDGGVQLLLRMPLRPFTVRGAGPSM